MENLEPWTVEFLEGQNVKISYKYGHFVSGKEAHRVLRRAGFNEAALRAAKVMAVSTCGDCRDVLLLGHEGLQIPRTQEIRLSCFVVTYGKISWTYQCNIPCDNNPTCEGEIHIHDVNKVTIYAYGYNGNGNGTRGKKKEVILG